MTQTTKINDTLLNANQPSQNKDTSTLINYPDVNQYIIQNNINHSNVIKDSRMNTLPKLPYKYGTYKGVVIHEVGEDNRTLQQWVDRMYDTYKIAFVHAFVDNKEIHPWLAAYMLKQNGIPPILADDNEGKPFSRNDYKHIVLAGKYNSRMTSYGTQREYKDGFYIQNTMFPLQASELHVDNSDLISTFLYQISPRNFLSAIYHWWHSRTQP